jgi:hypothetical protein
MVAGMYETLLVLHFVGLALGVGTGFANLTLGIATRELAPPERAQFFLRAFALGKNGSIGLALLLVTGIGMMLMRGVSATMAWGGPAFHWKLALIVLLIGAFGYLQVLIKRAKQQGGGPVMAQIPKAGQTVLAISLAIVVAAVIAFK